MIKKKTTIYSVKNLQSSYSCMLYLTQALKEKLDIQLWSFTKIEDIPEKYRNNCKSMFNVWYGHIKRIRYWIAKIHFFFHMIVSDDVSIVQDLDYFIPAYFAKKIKKKLIVIHYNTEIHGEDVYYPQYIISFYKNHADFPDLIIDCLKERARYRENHFCHKHVYYINNTIPYSDIRQINTSSNLYKKYLRFENDNPIVCYAGGCDFSRGLGSVIESIKQVQDKVNFVFFCHGSTNEINKVIKACKDAIGRKVCYVYPAISRKELLEVQQHCDIGINYYDPNLSINHLYAAPTKLFEYMACGLNVVSTNNEGINHIIEDNNIGVCIQGEESLGDAMIRLLDNGLCPKQVVKELFEKKYCYERDSKDTIAAIEKIVC